ncbi:protein of unknown function (plasmid) [Legionella fallonii LLAP-10]|uniref:Uncharacterized protein n=1 Tax=Legionella fallonii LLAP-10 TaxID=1212491 RepID=A0A098GBD5_9GAMM|nr:protein of unknown function [Legionella fallonii LLAP-10]
MLGTFTFRKSEKFIDIQLVAKLLLEDETINVRFISLAE